MTQPDKPNHQGDSPPSSRDEFAQQAEQSQPGLLREFVLFLKYNKKWWLVPIIVVLLLVAVLAMLGGTPLAPFIYPLW